VYLISLSKREKDYLDYILKHQSNVNMTTTKSEEIFTEDQQYDLNYRLKKKFIKLHHDYWLLVNFFKSYENHFQKRSTDQTIEAIIKAKSQIVSQDSLISSKCHYCRRSDIKLIEIYICESCFEQLNS